MKLYVTDFLFAMSQALDSVEKDLVGVSSYHSKRVAYLAVKLGEKLQLSKEILTSLSFAAALHDNALTEYIHEELKQGHTDLKMFSNSSLGIHCIYGEKNVENMPFYQEMKGTILYHHENANGTGPFHLKNEQTPLYAKILHLCDIVDVSFHLNNIDSLKYTKLCDFLHKYSSIFFDPALCDLFLATFDQESLQKITNNNIDSLLSQSIPEIQYDYTYDELVNISNLFAKIVDYKSPFTCTHSIGIADKAKKMGEYYHYSKEEQMELYVAGSLHDIGKLLTDTEILEKPGKLTEIEYEHIQNHAIGTYKILHQIRGFDRICQIASYHHEKLDGSGYPFQLTSHDLDQNERLLACLDIYQALTEKRPYKDSFSHDKAISILREMGEQNKLDLRIIQDIDQCFQS